MAKTVNTLPSGFTVDQQESTLPPGFQLDQPSDEQFSAEDLTPQGITAPGPGFTLQRPQDPNRQIPDLFTAPPIPTEVGDRENLKNLDTFAASRNQVRKGSVLGPDVPSRRQPSKTDFARRRMFESNKALKESGLGDEQINFAADVLDKLQRPLSIGRPVGAAAGAIAAGALATATIGPDPSDIITVPAVFKGVSGTVASALGAGAGGVLGENLQVRLEESRFLSAREALLTFGKEAGLELAGQAAVGIGKSIASNFIKNTIPDAAKLVDEFAEFGGQFSADQLDKRLHIHLLDKVSRSAFGTEELFEEFTEKQVAAATRMARSIVDASAEDIVQLSTKEFGELFAEGITKRSKLTGFKGRMFELRDDLFDPLWKQIDTEATGASVLTDRWKAIGKRALAREKRPGQRFLSDQGRKRMEDLANLPDKISFSDAKDFRSVILGESRRLGRDLDSATAITAELAQTMTEDMADPISSIGMSPKGVRLWQNTNKLWAATSEAFEKDFSERLARQMEKNPSSVVAQLIPKKNPAQVTRMKEAITRPLGRPDKEGEMVWKQLRTAWLADALESSTRDGLLKPKLLDTHLRNLGEESADILFDKATRDRIKSLKGVWTVIGRQAAEAQPAVKMGQIGGGIMVYKGVKEGDWLRVLAGGTISAGPRWWAKMATDPAGIKWITAGFPRVAVGKAGGLAIKLSPGQIARGIKISQEIDKREHDVFRPKKKKPDRRASTLNVQRAFQGGGQRTF